MDKIRDATKEDIYSYYGKQPVRSMRAICWERDGEIVGLAGVYFDRGMVAFSEFRPELKTRKKMIVKAVRALVKLYDSLPYPVYAVASEKHDSWRLLKKLGFEQTGASGTVGEILIRRPQ